MNFSDARSEHCTIIAVTRYAPLSHFQSLQARKFICQRSGSKIWNFKLTEHFAHQLQHPLCQETRWITHGHLRSSYLCDANSIKQGEHDKDANGLELNILNLVTNSQAIVTVLNKVVFEQHVCAASRKALFSLRSTLVEVEIRTHHH